MMYQLSHLFACLHACVFTENCNKQVSSMPAHNRSETHKNTEILFR